MIKHVRIRNYRSLRDVSLELRPRNILIGPNKSGKTSFLDAFRLLCHAITWGDVTRALDQRGGFSSVVWKGQQGLSDMLGPLLNTCQFELSGELADDRLHFNYLLAISGDAVGRVFIKREVLTVASGLDRQTLIDLEDGQGPVRRLDGTELFASPSNRKKPALSYDVPGWEAEPIRNAITLWHFYDLIPTVRCEYLEYIRCCQFIRSQRWQPVVMDTHPAN